MAESARLSDPAAREVTVRRIHAHIIRRGSGEKEHTSFFISLLSEPWRATLSCLGRRPPSQECGGGIWAPEPPHRRNFQPSYKTDNGMCTQQEWKIRGALRGFPHSSLSMGQTCVPCICSSLGRVRGSLCVYVYLGYPHRQSTAGVSSYTRFCALYPNWDITYHTESFSSATGTDLMPCVVWFSKATSWLTQPMAGCEAKNWYPISPKTAASAVSTGDKRRQKPKKDLVSPSAEWLSSGAAVRGRTGGRCHRAISHVLANVNRIQCDIWRSALAVTIFYSNFRTFRLCSVSE